MGIKNVESHDELDRIIMAALAIAHYLEIEEVVPMRKCERLAQDVRGWWE